MPDRPNEPGPDDETVIQPPPRVVDVEEEVVTEVQPPVAPPAPGEVVEEALGPRVVTQDERVRVEDDGSVTRRVERVEVEPPRRRVGSGVVPALLVILALAVAAVAATWYFTQSDTKPVPAVEGLALDDAVTRLQDEGFKADIVSEPNEAAEGTVFRQNPAAGSDADEGSEVQILVSTGPADVSIPNAVGVTETEARDRLAAAGLQASTVKVFASEPSGQVIAQSPAAGTSAAKGSTVRLNVSKGPASVTVPSVVGSLAADAEDRIVAAGLKPNTVRVPSAEAPGTVVAQNPTGGQVQAGSTVRLNVSTGP
jgi:serine/threonine-protein kinase